MMSVIARYGAVLIVCLTLGLAPYNPEPHLLGKLRWVAGGAEGMGLIDWGDLVLHGAPWLILFVMPLVDLIVWISGRGGSPAAPEADET